MERGVETGSFDASLKFVNSKVGDESATPAIAWDAARDHVARGRTIAIIDAIGVDCSEGVGDGASTLPAATETGESERLVQNADRMSGVEEFGVDRNGDTAQANDDTENTDSQNENEFGGDDHTRFVIPEILQHV